MFIMNHHHLFSVSLVTLAVLTGCNTVPQEKSPLDLARNDYIVAQNNPQTASLASSELKDAGDALQKANLAFAHRDSSTTVDHLSYLARQKVAIAQEAAIQKMAERRVANSNSVRDKIQLEARTREADIAKQNVQISQQNVQIARNQTLDAELRNSQLESQIKELNAKQTARGYVVTFGDVLFGTNQSTLKAGSARNLERLVDFLNSYPQRNLLIEGFTDSTGQHAGNLKLSERRSDAVRVALINAGINRSRIVARGYGESYPVASNSTSDGRQQNRRVEIVISDDSGAIPPR
jgi:outer membrane protein OmpA-like peptidoglycan-associated protein